MPPAKPTREMTAAERALADRYVPLANSLARPFGRAHRGLADDYRCVAYLELCRAAQDYRANRGASWGTYATLRIIYALRTEYRREQRRREHETPITRDHQLYLVDPSCYDEDEDGRKIHALIDQFPPTSRALIYLFLEHDTLTALAKSVGFSRSCVRDRLARAFESVRSTRARAGA